MKFYCVIIMAALAFSSCSSVGSSYRIDTEPSGVKVIVGKISRSVIEHDPAFPWFDAGYARYTVETASLDPVKARITELHFVLFLGTWCGDTKAEVPKMFRIFDAINLPPDRIEIYGADRMKNSGNGEMAAYAVTRVPTLIVYAGEKEIGRIVERPREGIEADISRMLKNAR